MNNIEKLAIEVGAEIIRGQEQEGWENPVYDLEPEFVFTYTQLEAFAKALQSSEPVASICKITQLPMGAKFKYLGTDKVYVLLDRVGYGLCCEYSEEIDNIGQGIYSISDEIKLNELEVEHVTHPPASVPLQKYNKLLDALKEILTGWNTGVIDAEEAVYKVEAEIKAIAEAEGK